MKMWNSFQALNCISVIHEIYKFGEWPEPYEAPHILNSHKTETKKINLTSCPGFENNHISITDWSFFKNKN